LGGGGRGAGVKVNSELTGVVGKGGNDVWSSQGGKKGRFRENRGERGA